MRRKDREITDYSKMLEILNECDCCRLGLLDETEVYIVPMNFGFEDIDGKIYLYMHGAPVGRKIDILKKDGTVTFELDRKHELVSGDIACAFSYMYQSIMGTGKAVLLDDFDEKLHGLKVIMSHYTDNKELQFNDNAVKNVAVIKLEVSNWTCKEH